ncbi:MAG: glycosyltransferase [Myxococcota bacterium]|nr:glycosyltransferase [Myxococcota bacterium]
MRILMVHPHDIYEPLEPWTIRITSLASCLTALGHEVRLVYHLARNEMAPGDIRHRQEFPFEVIPTIRHMGLGLRKARTLTRLARWADIVHVQKALPHAALPSAVAALVNRIPLHYDWDDWEAAIYEEACGRDANWRRINRFEIALAKIADTVSVASEALRKQAAELGVPSDCTFDAPVGADLDRFQCGGDGESIRSELGFDGPIAVYLGQLAGAHAAPLFLEAAVRVLERQKDAGFLVIGGGGTLPDLKREAERLGLGDRIRFTGAIPHNKVPDYLDVADVAVATLPDTQQAATKSPLKVVEYMAAGKAIVASRVGEAVRFLDDGRVGQLVEPGSAQALADGIAELLADPYHRSELGVAARDHLRKNHTWMHTARKLETAYEFARSKRRLSTAGRQPARGLGPEGLAAAQLPAQEVIVPQARIAPPPAPAPPANAAAVREIIRGPVDRVREGLRGRLDLAGVFHGEQAFTGPYTIQLDVTNRCNNDCIACWLHSPLLRKSGPNSKDLRAQLRFDLVKQMLDDAAAMGTRDIYMAGGGDPIVYPWLQETITHAKNHGMTVAVNTNFALADEAWCDWACDVGLDDMTISVWAGSQGTYDATHPNKKPEDFDRLKRMITYLNDRKRQVGQGPTVKLYQVVSHLNAHEFRAMYDLVESTGSDAVEYTVVDTVPGHTDVLLFDDTSRQRLLRESLELQEELAQRGESDRLFGFEQWLRRLRCEGVVDGLGDANIVHTFPCTIGWTFLRVMPDGRVTSCLKSHRIPIGNLNEDRLSDMWNNKRQREFRRMTKVYEKRNPWFSNIGNDPTAACGCEKSCDDLGRNLAMHRRMEAMSAPERMLVTKAAQLFGSTSRDADGTHEGGMPGQDSPNASAASTATS